MASLTVFVLLMTLTVQCMCLTQEQIDAINNLMEDMLECSIAEGATLSIVQDGELAHATGFGFVDNQFSAPVTTETLFSIASVTKHMTATLLAKLIEESQSITWDTPVRDILGEDFFFSDGYRSAQASPRDLISHRMGVPRNDEVWLYDMITNEELVDKIRFFEPDADFRTEGPLDWYNNIMYGVIGRVTEVMGGMSYSDLMMEHLFEPLGMHSTFIKSPDHDDHSNFARGYQRVDDDVMEVPFEAYNGGARTTAPAGAVVTNAEDMARWMKFMLSMGQNEDGVQVVSEAAMQRVRQPEVPLPLLGGGFLKPRFPETLVPGNRYSLGLFLGYYKGYELLSHTGGSPGMFTHMYLYPALNIGIYYTFGAIDNFISDLIAGYITDIILNEDPWVNSQQLCVLFASESDTEAYNYDLYNLAPKPRKYHVANIEPKVPQHQLEAYAGTYGNFAYGNITVLLLPSETLILSVGRLGLFQLIPLGNDVFSSDGLNDVSRLIPIRNDIVFSSSEGSNNVDILIFGNPESTVFVRNLQECDAPPPPNVQC